MTIATQTSKAGPYVADGVQTRYPYAFPVTDLSHVKVYVDGVEVRTGVSIGDGEVVFSKAPAEGSSVGILRVVPITQETDLQNNTAFYPEIMEGAYDKLTMICQQLQEESSRSLKVPPGTENEGTLIGAITRIEVLAEQAQTTLVEITEKLERGKQLGNYITVNSVDGEGRLVCDKDSLPTALTTNTGAIYPLEKGSLVETDNAYLIDTKPYLSYMNEETFTGPWLVWRTGGPAGRPDDTFLRLSGGTIAGDLEVQGALTLNGKPVADGEYLPLAGGTMTGDIVFASGNTIKLDDNTKNLNLFAGTSWQDSSHIIIRGTNLPQDDPNYDARGQIVFVACREDGVTNRLWLNPNGDLKLNNKRVVCVESWSSGTSWYRKYSDGWIEQGGLVGSGGNTTVTLPTAFTATTYTVMVQTKNNTGHTYQAAADSLTKTSFKIHSVDGAAGCQKWWYACGK